MNALGHQHVNHLAFELHDVVVQAIVPFANELNDGKAFFVIDEKILQNKVGEWMESHCGWMK